MYDWPKRQNLKLNFVIIHFSYPNDVISNTFLIFIYIFDI